MSDWNRQQLEDHLLDYLYDELEPDEKRAFERGLIAHPEVAAEVAAHQRTRRAFAAELGPAPALPTGALDRVEAALAEASGGTRTTAPTEVKKTFWTTLSEGLRGLAFRPTFALAMVGLLVGGVALYTSRKGEVSSLGERVESQALPPVLIQPAAPVAVRSETIETVSRAMAEPEAMKPDAPAGGAENETASAAPSAMKKELAAPEPLADKMADEAKAAPKMAVGSVPSTNMIGGAKGLAVQGGAFATGGAFDDGVDEVAEARQRAEREREAARAAEEDTAKAEKAEQESAARAMAAPRAADDYAPVDEGQRPAKSSPTTETATKDRDVPVSRKDNSERAAPLPEPPAAPPQDSRGQSDSKPADADRLWTLGQQQVAAGAWSDAERTLTQLAKAEGETERVKKLRAQLKARPAQVQRASDEQLPPDPPKPASPPK